LRQHSARNGGANELTMRAIDVRPEHKLHHLVRAYRMVNRKWQSWLECELHSAGRVGMWHLRLAVETRLKPYQELVRSRKLPKVSTWNWQLTVGGRKYGGRRPTDGPRGRR
jgi:hypothetical protein